MSDDPVKLFSILTFRGTEMILQDTSHGELERFCGVTNGTHENGNKDDGLILQEMRAWHDAWIKRNEGLEVSNGALLLAKYPRT